MPTTQTAGTPVTMKAVQAMMDDFRRDMQAMTNRLTTRLDGKRARPSSAILPTPQAPPQLDSPATVTQQQPSLAKKKRNERTRQQYKRKKALHVTVQSSVKEVEHTGQTKPREHIVSERIKLVAWDWSTTSLQTLLQQSWCWHVVIPWDGMIMVLVLWCGVSGMPRIGIG